MIKNLEEHYNKMTDKVIGKIYRTCLLRVRPNKLNL